MRSRTRLRLAASAALTTAVLAVGVVPTGAGATPSGPFCGIWWGSTAKSAAEMTGAPVADVRVGRHPCFDRMVVDLGGGPVAGYDVRYTDLYRAPGSGAPLPVAGGAVLQVIARAPAYDSLGRSTVPWAGTGVIIGPDEFRAGGFQTFRNLVWGGSFEGQSSFGLGVRARLPFRVFQLEGPGDGTRLVIDVAHWW